METRNPLDEAKRTLQRLRETLDIVESSHHSLEVETAIELAQQLGIDLSVAEVAFQKKLQGGH